MIRPLPGVVHDEARRALDSGRHGHNGGWGRVHFAHADLSGLSLFEEANHWGVAAADRTLARL
jgi:hypothetical protein